MKVKYIVLGIAAMVFFMPLAFALPNNVNKAFIFDEFAIKFLENVSFNNFNLSGISYLCLAGECRSSWVASNGSGSGTVTSITAGLGLNATTNPITTTGTIAINSPTCSSVEFSKWNGTGWQCGVANGTISQLNQGDAIILTPNPITTTGSVALNFTRVYDFIYNKTQTDTLLNSYSTLTYLNTNFYNKTQSDGINTSNNNHIAEVNTSNRNGDIELNVSNNNYIASNNASVNNNILFTNTTMKNYVDTRGFITGVADLWVNITGDTMTGDLIINATLALNEMLNDMSAITTFSIRSNNASEIQSLTHHFTTNTTGDSVLTIRGDYNFGGEGIVDSTVHYFTNEPSGTRAILNAYALTQSRTYTFPDIDSLDISGGIIAIASGSQNFTGSNNFTGTNTFTGVNNFTNWTYFMGNVTMLGNSLNISTGTLHTNATANFTGLTNFSNNVSLLGNLTNITQNIWVREPINTYNPATKNYVDNLNASNNNYIADNNASMNNHIRSDTLSNAPLITMPSRTNDTIYTPNSTRTVFVSFSGSVRCANVVGSWEAYSVARIYAFGNGTPTDQEVGRIGGIQNSCTSMIGVSGSIGFFVPPNVKYSINNTIVSGTITYTTHAWKETVI